MVCGLLVAQGFKVGDIFPSLAADLQGFDEPDDTDGKEGKARGDADDADDEGKGTEVHAIDLIRLLLQREEDEEQADDEGDGSDDHEAKSVLLAVEAIDVMVMGFPGIMGDFLVGRLVFLKLAMANGAFLLAIPLQTVAVLAKARILFFFAHACSPVKVTSAGEAIVI